MHIIYIYIYKYIHVCIYISVHTHIYIYMKKGGGDLAYDFQEPLALSAVRRCDKEGLSADAWYRV